MLSFEWPSAFVGTGGATPIQQSVGADVSTGWWSLDPKAPVYAFVGTGGWQIARAPIRKVFLPPDQVATIKDTLSLNTSELARVFRVERPTVYSWLGGAQPQPTNLKRITAIFDIACRWAELSGHAVGERVRQPLVSDRSLVDLLQDEELNLDLINSVMTSLAISSVQRPVDATSPAVLAARYGFTRLERDRAQDAVGRAIRRRRGGR